MPRKPRFFIPDIPVHVVQRGHSREPVFFEKNDYFSYLRWLTEGADRYGCAIHAYVLMTNHVHILASPKEALGITRMMQYVGRHYVPYINYTYGTSGSIWEGRYKASLVQAGRHLLICMRYIELNPVRANMVQYPEQYPWSSYHHHAGSHPDGLIRSHPSYLALGADDASRVAAYKELFRAHLDNRTLVEIQAAWQTGTPFGNAFFKQKVEEKLGCKIGQARRGRPYPRRVKGL